MENKIPLYHNACKKLACYYIGQEFAKDAMIRACDFELLDGTNPKPSDILICGNCGRYMEINLDCEYNYNE